jgi:hypothetical protein
VIRECIYGVDLNPLAVELCKVALWLEAHNPGEPLNFLDHHIKCGNAIVGFARREEAERGVPDEAFKTLPGDDKAPPRCCASATRRNAKTTQVHTASPALQKQLDDILRGWHELATMPEREPDEIDAKKARYIAFSQSADAWLLGQIASIPIAQFYQPKAADNLQKFITDATFRRYWKGEVSPQGQATAEAWALAERKRFFHWFLEFPEITERGGFDCILGNPPYLGGQGLSGTYGSAFCEYVKWEYAPTGLSDLVVFFVRRIYSLLRPGGFTAFITTNSIKDGDIRKDGLEQVLAQGGTINMAVRGIKWPGRANLVVSLVALHRGNWRGKRVLDGKEVPVISAYFEDIEDLGNPSVLSKSANRVFQGTIPLGEGFLLQHSEAEALIQSDSRNKEVIFPVINGQETNNHPDQLPGRSIINFLARTEGQAACYELPFRIVRERVKPARLAQKNETAKTRWWRYYRYNEDCYNALSGLRHCYVAAATTKYLNLSAVPTNYVFLNTLYVLTSDRWDLYAVAQSSLHEVWARKYSGALKQDLRYSSTDCFDTFPFPEGLWVTDSPVLADIGERYHGHRRALMRQLWLGLTDIYNLFHSRDLGPAQVAKVSKKSDEEAEAGYQSILELRRLHRELDIAIRDAYGWTDLNLNHDFIEVETLPENDRVRYTISPAARKEVLKRLLVTSALSTTDLITASVRASTALSKRLLVVANFSGFLSLQGKLKASKKQLEELFRYSSGPEHVAVWLEPQMNFATGNGGVLRSIGQWVKESWHRFARVVGIDGLETPFVTSEVKFRSTLTPGRLRPIRLAVMRLDLVRS